MFWSNAGPSSVELTWIPLRKVLNAIDEGHGLDQSIWNPLFGYGSLVNSKLDLGVQNIFTLEIFLVETSMQDLCQWTSRQVFQSSLLGLVKGALENIIFPILASTC